MKHVLFIYLICIVNIIMHNSLNAAPANVTNLNISIDSLTNTKNTQIYEIYVQGVDAQSSGKIDQAKQYYELYLSQNYHHDALNLIYIDLLARYIGISVSTEDWAKVVQLGSRLGDINQQVRENYHNTAWMYLMYAYSLNNLNKCDNIEKVIQAGLYYVERTYEPTDKEYYELRFQHFVSKLNIRDYDSANRILDEIKRINTSSGRHIVDDQIMLASQHLMSDAVNDPYKDKDKFVEQFSKDIVDISLATAINGYEKTEEAWHGIVSLAENFLKNTYFDNTSTSDENIWTKFIAWYSVLINGFGKGLNIPDRSRYAYDYVLTCKNFLDWHSHLTKQEPIKWSQIKNSLDNDELAIEIIPHCNEALIISRLSDAPEIIELDSLAMNQIINLDDKDPLAINKLYQTGSPLSNIINTISPAFKEKKRIYISGSNRLAAINWAAAPYKGHNLSDSLEIFQMTSTAQIPTNKLHQKNASKINSLILYGGIDYDNLIINHQDTLSRKFNWDYLPNVPETLRSGFSYLPYSQTEIDSIAKLCHTHGITEHRYSGIRANESIFKETSYSPSTVIHLATHSFLLPSYSYKRLSELSKTTDISRMGTIMSSTGLLFAGCNNSLKNGMSEAEDGILTAKEISQMDLSEVELVVLSSCSSGLGDLNNVNGIVYGLSNAFKSAGVKQILVSLWDIPDYTTNLFMISFYNSLLRGYNSRESLKAAQKHLITHGFADPYYWGAFVILD